MEETKKFFVTYAANKMPQCKEFLKESEARDFCKELQKKKEHFNLYVQNGTEFWEKLLGSTGVRGVA